MTLLPGDKQRKRRKTSLEYHSSSISLKNLLISLLRTEEEKVLKGKGRKMKKEEKKESKGKNRRREKMQLQKNNEGRQKGSCEMPTKCNFSFIIITAVLV